MNCARCRKTCDTKYLSCSACLQQQRAYKKKNNKRIKIINRRWKQVNWARRMVSHSRGSDALYNRLPANMLDYITPEYLHRLRDAQKNMCAFCTIDMQHHHRKLHDGITVQRLVNSHPHEKQNCLLACHSCNCRRVETGCNEPYLKFKRGRLYFERLLKDGYPYATSLRRPRIF